MRPTRLLFALLAACSSTSIDEPTTVVPTTPSISEATLEAGPLPSSSIEGEALRAGAIDMRVVRKIADHARWKIACTFDLDRMVHLCATDSLDEKWTPGKVGTRVLVIAKDFTVTEHLISDQVFSSYLWGDFDSDGRPDLLAFRDAEERWKPEEQPPAVLFLGTEDSAKYRAGDPVPFDHVAKAGVVLDVDLDGCADALVLGSGVEKDVEKGDVTYFADALLRGDCNGHFTRTEIASFDKASPRLGRTAVITDLDGDRCPDILIGNYRGFANDALLSDCNGGFRRDGEHPATGAKKPNGWYGHTVAIAPYDLEGRGALDLAIANLWHPDDRGAYTDPAHVLVHDADGAWTREEMPYFLEAPFGFWVGDLDQDGTSDWLFATGERWGAYEGQAALVRRGSKKAAWRDTKGWLTMREAPSAIDANLDGFSEWIADGRIFANHSVNAAGRGHFLGFALKSHDVVLSGIIARVSFTDGSAHAVALAADGRGMPSTIFTLPLGNEAKKPSKLEVALTNGHVIERSIAELAIDRYHVITLAR